MNIFDVNPKNQCRWQDWP